MATSPGFEPLPRARYSAETIDGTPWIVARAARNWFVLPFIAFWLTLWSIGGLAAMTEAASAPSARPFLLVWLLFWAIGWVVAGSIVALRQSSGGRSPADQR